MPISSKCLSFSFLLLGITLIHCGGESESETSDITEIAFEAIEPGGETTCARGTPFRFFHRPSSATRLVIDFEGGGACWDTDTCSFADALFNPEAMTLDELNEFLSSEDYGGIYENSEENAFRDWSFIHIPYCTGDVHWGNAEKDYGDNIVIQHRGFVNATATLNWIYEQYPDLEEIFVVGYSAGSYGAILHSAYVAEHYPNAKVRVLGDSGVGIITDDFFADSFPNWAAEASLPTWIESLQIPINELNTAKVYSAIADYYPNQRFAQQTTTYDYIQTYFYEAMGGDPADWPDLMRDNLASITSTNFRSYISPGPMHCIVPYPFYYERVSSNIAFTDWLHDFVSGNMPNNVSCTGDDCKQDPMCDECNAIHSLTGACSNCLGWPPEE